MEEQLLNFFFSPSEDHSQCRYRVIIIHVARTRQHWNEYDTWIHDRFLKHTPNVSLTRVPDTFWTCHSSMIWVSVLH